MPDARLPVHGPVTGELRMPIPVPALSLLGSEECCTINFASAPAISMDQKLGLDATSAEPIPFQRTFPTSVTSTIELILIMSHSRLIMTITSIMEIKSLIPSSSLESLLLSQGETSS